MKEAHLALYEIHPSGTIMYGMIKPHYWWLRMKRDIAEYVSKYLTCQQIKAKHQSPAGMMQPLSILEWK